MTDADTARGGLDALPPGPAILLVRPQLGENVGTAARAMLNFGLAELRLIDPQCGWPNVKALNAASGATEILNRLQLLESVEAATADLHRLYATTARPRDLPKRALDPVQAIAEIRREMATGHRVGIMFGPERTGLTNDDLLFAEAVVTVPLNPAFTSLNLAQAVLLMAYEWFRVHAEPAPPAPSREDPARPASKGELEGLFQHLLVELDRVDFFRAPDRRISLIRTLKLILQRAQLREPDVHLLHGIVKALVRGRRGPT